MIARAFVAVLVVGLVVLTSCAATRHRVRYLAAPEPTIATTTSAVRTTSTPTLQRASRGRPRPAAALTAGAGDLLDRMATCESNRNTRAVAIIAGRPRYFGAFQMTPGSWARYGNGQPILEQTYEVQKAAAARQLGAEGLGPWPVCGPRAASTGGGGSW